MTQRRIQAAWLAWSCAWAVAWLWLAVQAWPRPFCADYQVSGSPGCVQWASSGSWAGMAVFLALAGVSGFVAGLPVWRVFIGPLTRG